MKTIIILLLLMIATTVGAVEIYDKETGKYLGQLGGNKYAPDSTSMSISVEKYPPNSVE